MLKRWISAPFAMPMIKTILYIIYVIIRHKPPILFFLQNVQKLFCTGYI